MTAINDDAMASQDDMLTLLERRRPGDTVTQTLWQAGLSRRPLVVLGSSE